MFTTKTIALTPPPVYKILLFLLAVLTLLNLSSIGMKYYLYEVLQHDKHHIIDIYFIDMFNFNLEKNIPTYFSVINLFASAFLLYVIYSNGRSRSIKHNRQWLYLSCIFIFLGLDELLSFHEILTYPTRYLLNTWILNKEVGLLHYAWFVPYGIIAAFLGVYFLKLLFSIPKAISLRIIIAGLIFVSGAVGINMFQGQLTLEIGEENIINNLISTLEEILEMLGIIYFIKTLLTHLENNYGSFVISLRFFSKKSADTGELDSLMSPPDRKPIDNRAVIHQATLEKNIDTISQS